MFKNLGLLILVISFVGCSSPDKKADDSAATGSGSGSTVSDAGVTDEAITFHPEGSDSSTIQGLDTVFFGYDQATLTPQARASLKANADWIRNHSNVNTQIEGHCDQHGSIEYNLSLGERRAKSVKKYLASLGIPESRMTIISYGKEKLLDQGDSDAARARNRRANFLPIPR